MVNSNPNKQKIVTPLDITKVFYVSDFEELFERNPVQQVAELLGFENYEWISYEYSLREAKENPEGFKNKGIKTVNSIFTF